MSPNPNNLASQLTAEQTAWAELIAALANEEQALIEGDADRLHPLEVIKLDCLRAVSDLAQARSALLQAAGYEPHATGMDAWLSQSGNTRLRTDWLGLQQLEREARACNQRIGLLIDMRLTATRQSLNVLMHAAGGKAGLYDPSGQAVAARSTKPLAAA